MINFSYLNKHCPVLVDQNSWIAFQLGLFFLPSSAFISGLFLIKAAIIGSVKKEYIADDFKILIF